MAIHTIGRATWTTRLGRQVRRTLVLRLPLLAVGLFALFPIFWLARTSLMTEADLIRLPLSYLPIPLTFENFIRAFDQLNLARVLLNSAFVALGTSGLALVLVMLSAYAISRFRIRGRGLIMLLLLGTQMLPDVLLLVPLFIILRDLQLLDTLPGLVLAESIFVVPFSAVLLKQFFDRIPANLDEAAMLDGCNRVQALRHVVFPLVLPGAVAVTILGFITVWNSLILPTVLLVNPDNHTLPISLMLLRDRNTVVWGMQAAGGMLNLVPTLILFALVQRYLVSGLASGAAKR
jgi:multiple sugar transport system permease protein